MRTLPPLRPGVLTLCAALALAAPPLAAEQPGPHLSGDARMGLVWERPPPWAQRETGLRLDTRTRLRMQFTGQTDGGVTFGAEVELDPDRNRSTPRRVFVGD